MLDLQVWRVYCEDVQCGRQDMRLTTFRDEFRHLMRKLKIARRESRMEADEREIDFILILLLHIKFEGGCEEIEMMRGLHKQKTILAPPHMVNEI
jgi:hypothetical protein